MAAALILILITAIAAAVWRYGVDSRDGDDWFRHDPLSGPRTAGW